MDANLKTELIDAVNILLFSCMQQVKETLHVELNQGAVINLGFITKMEIASFLSGYMLAKGYPVTSDVSEVLNHFYN